MSRVRFGRITIIGFGGLPAGSTYDFSEGLQVMLRENGEGKTRLMEAICAVLYGFWGDGKRANVEVDNYRVRFKPWNGGNYGVKLEFTVDGDAYEATRRFGETAAKDTFELKELRLGIPSTRYTAKLGEELLGLDLESFRRSLMIGCGDVLAKDSDALKARVGHFSPEQNDQDVYEVAKGKLADVKKELGSKSNTKYSRVKNRISEIEMALRGTDGLEEEMRRAKEKISLEQKRIAEAEAAQLQKQKLQCTLFEVEKIEAKRQRYEDYQKQLRAIEERCAEERTHFPKGIPDMEQLLWGREQCAIYLRNCAELERLQLTEEELEDCSRLQEEFSKAEPEVSVLEEYEAVAADIAEGKKQLAQRSLSEYEECTLEEGRRKYAGKQPVAERDKDLLVEYRVTLSDEANQMLSYLQKYEDLEEEVKAKRETQRELERRADLAYQERQKAPSKRYGIFAVVALLFGVVAAAGGGLLLHRGSMLIGVICVIAALALVVLGIAFLRKNKRLLVEYQRGLSEKTPEECEAEVFAQDCEALSIEQQQLAEGLSAYFARFDLGEFYSHDAYAKLLDHKHCLIEYERLEEQKSLLNQDGLEQRVSEGLKNLAHYLDGFGIELALDPGRQLLSLKNDMQRYSKLLEQAKRFSECLEKGKEARIELSFRLLELGVELSEDDLVLDMDPDQFFALQIKHLEAFERYLEENSQVKMELYFFLEQYAPEEVERITQPAWERPRELQGMTIGDLNKEFTELRESIRQMNASLQEYEDTLEILQKRMEEAEALRAEKEEKQEAEQTMEERLRLLNLTEACIEKARQEMTHRYVDPLLSRIRHYYEVITDRQDSSRLHMDANLKLTMEAEGTEHDLLTLSNGYQDLIGFARRVAYADTLFPEGSRPMLILDDPFVNLDDAKLPRAWRLLEELAEEYQVLYFTCSASRVHLA